MEELLGYMNLIHQLSISENAKTTQIMIQNITDIIKYKFVRNDEIVTLHEEIMQIEKLIYVFRARFGACLEFTKKIPDHFPDVYVPNYTIAAFAENAMYHGLIPKDGAWKLLLEIVELDKSIEVNIADNGVGFDTEVLNTKFDSTGKTGTIENVIFKTNSFFAEKDLVYISSKVGKGTTVLIKIPKA